MTLPVLLLILGGMLLTLMALFAYAHFLTPKPAEEPRVGKGGPALKDRLITDV